MARSHKKLIRLFYRCGMSGVLAQKKLNSCYHNTLVWQRSDDPKNTNAEVLEVIDLFEYQTNEPKKMRVKIYWISPQSSLGNKA